MADEPRLIAPQSIVGDFISRRLEVTFPTVAGQILRSDTRRVTLAFVGDTASDVVVAPMGMDDTNRPGWRVTLDSPQVFTYSDFGPLLGAPWYGVDTFGASAIVTIFELLADPKRTKE